MRDDLKNSPIWVAWKFQLKPGKTKPDKIPVQGNGQYAATDNPSTWQTYDQAKAITPKDGIGIVFEANNSVVGIDFDNILTKKHDLKCLSQELRTFILEANTYTEFSPSGTGLHLLFQIDEDPDLIANKKPLADEPLEGFEKPPAVEVYSEGRFFTFTENEVESSPPLRNITKQEFTDLLKTIGYPWGKQRPVQQDPTNPQDSNGSVQALTNQEVLDKMFSAKNANKIKKLYDGSTAAHNSDYSSADLALCMHLAFWTNKNYSQIEDLWLNSPLGNRKKTQEREDYRKLTIEQAINTTTETYELKGRALTEKQTKEYNFTTNKYGFPELILTNIVKVVDEHPDFKNIIRDNEFSGMVEFLDSYSNKWIALKDSFVTSVRFQICSEFYAFRKLTAPMTVDAIKTVASKNKVNPPKDYLLSLTWDKTPRLDTWLHCTFGVPNTPVYQAIGSNWLKGLAKRVLQPGCQFDEVLVLEGKQGWRKSTTIRKLGQPWHVETTHSIDGKDFYMIIAQNVIVEFSEGEIFNRNSIAKLKAEVTKTHDQLRPPYERGLVTFPRSCVFAITTNNLELRDDTGNRRWLPITLHKPGDVDWIVENRDQLFAEATYRIKELNETTYEYPEQELKALQTGREEGDAYDEEIIEWYLSIPYSQREEGVSLLDACKAIYADLADPANSLNQRKMGGMLRRVLKLEKKVKTIDDQQTKRWCYTDETKRLFPKNDITVTKVKSLI